MIGEKPGDTQYVQPTDLSQISIPSFPTSPDFSIAGSAGSDYHFGLLQDYIYVCPEKSEVFASFKCDRWNIHTGEETALTSELLHSHWYVRTCLVTVGNRLWIGGSQQTSPADSDKSEFMDTDGVWTDGPTLPQGMYGHSCITIGDNQVLVGNGLTPVGAYDIMTSWILNTDSGHFTPNGPNNFRGDSCMLGGPFMLSNGRCDIITVNSA